MPVTHPFVSGVTDTNLPAGAVGPTEWNDNHTVDVSFLDLNDVPATYTGQAGKYVKVNVSENGVAFGTTSGGFGSPADEHPGTPNAMDDEFDDSSGMSGAVNGLNARWSWVQQSTSTITYPYESWMKLLVPAHTGHEIRGIVQTLPALPATFLVKWSFGGTNTNASGGGVWLYDHANGDSYMFGMLLTGGAVSLRLDRYTALNSGVTNVTNLTIGITNQIWTKITYASLGGAITYGYSTDGITFTDLATTDITSATRIGLAIDEQNNSGNSYIQCDYFRRTA